MEQRAGLEFMQLMTSPTYYGWGVARGDGAPVMVIPGFMGSDRYLTVLRGWLRRVGYHPHRSGIWLMAGSPYDLMARVIARAEEVHEIEGQRIKLIGHSMGGIMARILARLRPDLVDHVITLGSPLSEYPRQAAHPAVQAAAEFIVRDRSIPLEMERGLMGLLVDPLPADVRLTAIYTRQDPIVDWRACIDSDPRSEAIEVSGTHTGLSWNSQVYRHLGELLAA
jgi:triacylglycerol lipase